MAKGDSVRVMVRGFSDPVEIRASAAGRTVRVERTGGKSPKVRIIEYTRTGKSTGCLMEFAAGDVAGIIEARTPPKPTAKDRKRPVPGQVGLMETLDAGRPTVAPEAGGPRWVDADATPVFSASMVKPSFSAEVPTAVVLRTGRAKPGQAVGIDDAIKSVHETLYCKASDGVAVCTLPLHPESTRHVWDVPEPQEPEE